jgi:hypothetical protein
MADLPALRGKAGEEEATLRSSVHAFLYRFDFDERRMGSSIRSVEGT